MYDFKKYLFQTEGESCYLFWMDVERLKNSKKSYQWIRKLILRINRHYIADGGKFQLKSAFRDELATMQKIDEPQERWSTMQQIKYLMKCQEEVLVKLRTYWSKRYAIIIEEEVAKGVRMMFPRTCTAKTEDEQDRESDDSTSRAKDKQVGKSDGTSRPERKRQTSGSTHFPPLVASESDYETEMKRSHIKLQMSRVPPLISNKHRGSITQAVSNESIAQMSILSSKSTADFLISHSTFSLFSSTSSTFDYPLEDFDNVQLEPYLCASLRADFTAGNPFLKFLKFFKNDIQAFNYMLFWQSVENILTQDEMKRWFNGWTLRNFGEEAADKTSPYLSYFEPYFLAKDLQQLCHFFLQPKALHKVSLPTRMVNELMSLLPRGLGRGLLLTAQDHASKVSTAAVCAEGTIAIDNVGPLAI